MTNTIHSEFLLGREMRIGRQPDILLLSWFYNCNQKGIILATIGGGGEEIDGKRKIFIHKTRDFIETFLFIYGDELTNGRVDGLVHRLFSHCRINSEFWENVFHPHDIHQGHSIRMLRRYEECRIVTLFFLLNATV